ncbi:MAG TPA: hypothetical protein VHD36_13060 [Pirellulales bacterium]|nr:hypothetical protein [Pirellulales bacterium]
MLPLTTLPTGGGQPAAPCESARCGCAARTPRRGWEIAAGALSLGIWAIVPKCPICLAAHVALWSGLGLSFAAATLVRWSLLGVSAALLAGALLLSWRRLGALR